MTNTEKASQIGQLMLDFKAAREEYSQYKEKVRRFQQTLSAAGSKPLASALTESNTPYLSVVEPGPAQSRIDLPTTTEVLGAVTRLEELKRSVEDLRNRLSNLGFSV